MYATCKPNPNHVPTDLLNPGTEFLVLQIRNTNINSIYLHTMFVNGIQHVWDVDTAGMTLNAEINDLDSSDGTNYPWDGKFSIISSSGGAGLVQRTSNEVFPGEEVRVVIKLNPYQRILKCGGHYKFILTMEVLSPQSTL